MHLARSSPIADAASAAPNAATSRPMPWELCASEPGMTAARAQPGRRGSSRNKWASAASVVRLQPLPGLPTRVGTSGARAGTLPASSVQTDAKSLVKQLFARESPGLSMLIPLVTLCSQEGLRGRPGTCLLQAEPSSAKLVLRAVWASGREASRHRAPAPLCTGFGGTVTLPSQGCSKQED